MWVKKENKSVLGVPGGKDEQVNRGISRPESHCQGKEIHKIAQNKQLCLSLAGRKTSCHFGARGLTQSKFQRNQQGANPWAVCVYYLWRGPGCKEPRNTSTWDAARPRHASGWEDVLMKKRLHTAFIRWEGRVRDESSSFVIPVSHEGWLWQGPITSSRLGLRPGPPDPEWPRIPRLPFGQTTPTRCSLWSLLSLNELIAFSRWVVILSPAGCDCWIKVLC